jgi:hypothetical protein
LSSLFGHMEVGGDDDMGRSGGGQNNRHGQLETWFCPVPGCPKSQAKEARPFHTFAALREIIRHSPRGISSIAQFAIVPGVHKNGV